MSAFAAINEGALAVTRCTGWGSRLVRRPRGRRQALAVCQDASGV